MTYKLIKKLMLRNVEPTENQLNDAINHQTTVVGLAAASLAKHAAKLHAAAHHPFPLPEDQTGRVKRRAALVEHEQSRLFRLYLWREILVNKPVTAPQGLGSA